MSAACCARPPRCALPRVPSMPSHSLLCTARTTTRTTTRTAIRTAMRTTAMIAPKPAPRLQSPPGTGQLC
eukprot:1684327-Prymnesium_polylepis.1